MISVKFTIKSRLWKSLFIHVPPPAALVMNLTPNAAGRIVYAAFCARNPKCANISFCKSARGDNETTPIRFIAVLHTFQGLSIVYIYIGVASQKHTQCHGQARCKRHRAAFKFITADICFAFGGGITRFSTSTAIQFHLLPTNALTHTCTICEWAYSSFSLCGLYAVWLCLN